MGIGTEITQLVDVVAGILVHVEAQVVFAEIVVCAWFKPEEAGQEAGITRATRRPESKLHIDVS